MNRVYDQFMSDNRRARLLVLARLWAFPLWYSAIHSRSADAINEDVDWWMRCMNDKKLLALDHYSRFAYLAGALPEFRNLVHFRLRSSPLLLRVLLRAIYRPEPTLRLGAERIGAGLFIQHGFATVVFAESIGSHCWINQQVTIGYDTRGKPTLGDDVRVGAGAMVIGHLTLHDGATVGVNATVIHDVEPGETVVAPLAVPLKRRGPDGDAPA